MTEYMDRADDDNTDAPDEPERREPERRPAPGEERHRKDPGVSYDAPGKGADDERGDPDQDDYERGDPDRDDDESQDDDEDRAREQHPAVEEERHRRRREGVRT